MRKLTEQDKKNLKRLLGSVRVVLWEGWSRDVCSVFGTRTVWIKEEVGVWFMQKILNLSILLITLDVIPLI